MTLSHYVGGILSHAERDHVRRDPGDVRPAGDPPDSGGDPDPGGPGPLAPRRPARAHTLPSPSTRPRGEAEKTMKMLKLLKSTYTFL